MGRRVLFLDLDGVIDRESNVRALNEILNRAKPDVVISSSWRVLGEERLSKWAESVGIRGLRIIGITPDFEGEPRGREVRAWLDAHKIPQKEAVVLDDDDDWGDLERRWVQTDFQRGLTRADVTRVLRLWKIE